MPTKSDRSKSSGLACGQSDKPFLMKGPNLRNSFLLLTCLVWGSLSIGKTPSVVLIVSDDQGYRDLGCFGSDEIKTPHLDRLAKGGVKLTPACLHASRGLFSPDPQRNGIYDMIRNEAPDYGYEYKAGEYEATFGQREILLPEVLGKGLLDCDLRQVGLGCPSAFFRLDDFYEHGHRLLYSRALRGALDVSKFESDHRGQGDLLHFFVRTRGSPFPQGGEGSAVLSLPSFQCSAWGLQLGSRDQGRSPVTRKIQVALSRIASSGRHRKAHGKKIRFDSRFRTKPPAGLSSWVRLRGRIDREGPWLFGGARTCRKHHCDLLQ